MRGKNPVPASSLQPKPSKTPIQREEERFLYAPRAHPFSRSRRDGNHWRRSHSEPYGLWLWCSANERGGLGNNLVPDYVTSVKEGGLYGWPWYYMGGHQDPRLMGKHPELKSKVITPDVLVQPHMASLEMTFYPVAETAFPSQYDGDGFAAEHGPGTVPVVAATKSFAFP